MYIYNIYIYIYIYLKPQFNILSDHKSFYHLICNKLTIILMLIPLLLRFTLFHKFPLLSCSFMVFPNLCFNVEQWKKQLKLHLVQSSVL